MSRAQLVGFWNEVSQDREFLGEYAGHSETWRTDSGCYGVFRYPGSPGLYVELEATRTDYRFWNRIGACGSLHRDERSVRGTYLLILPDYGPERAFVRKGLLRMIGGAS